MDTNTKTWSKSSTTNDRYPSDFNIFAKLRNFNEKENHNMNADIDGSYNQC